MISALLLVVALVALALSVESKTLREAFPTVDLSKSARLTLAELRSSKEFFTHARELLSAVSSNDASFTVRETVQKTGALNLGEYLDENPAGNEYDTSTTYTLSHEALGTNVVNLDAAHHASAIRELTHESMTHCAGAKDLLILGRILVGSSEGEWFGSEEVQSHLLSGSGGLLPKHETKPTLVLIRRILSVEAHAGLGAECMLVKTESLSSLELFEEINITSLSSHPFSTAYFNADIATSEEQRNLQMTMGYGNVLADPPLISCQASSWKGGSYSIARSSKSYALGLTSGCIEYNTKTPGFNMNYNTKTHTAINAKIDLSNGYGAGMTCENCYAFMGNSFLAILNYKLKGMQLSFEVKINGGAGVNMAITMTNPTISSTYSKQLLAAQTTYSTITLGTGLSVTYKFGGILAEVSGSGSATGVALMQGGATGDLQMGAIFDGSTMYAQSNNFASFVKPHYNGGFSSFGKTSRFSANVNMRASTDFGVSLGTLFSASGDVSIVGQMAIDYSMAATSTLTASILRDVPVGTRELSASAKAFTPGTTVPIRVEYTGFNPDEDLVVAYSFVTTTGHEYRIMSREMRSDPSGAGHFDTRWQIPWDSRFVGLGKAHINVRCSNILSRTVSTTPFDVNIYSDNQSIFSTPRGGDRIPYDVPVRVRWNKDLLAYFKGSPDSMIRGERNQADHVIFNLHGQKLRADGSVEKEMEWALQRNSAIQNTGDAHVVFPSSQVKGFHRFYLSVHHAEAASVSGSNDGYFTLGLKSNPAANAAAAMQSTAVPRMIVAAPPVPQTLEAVEEQERRELNSCGANMVLVTMKAQYSGGITNVRVKLLGSLPSWTGDWPVTNLMTPYQLCFSPPAVKSGGPGFTSIANPSCSVPSIGKGKCQDTAWPCTGGQYYGGYCAGSNNVKCCVANPSSSTASKNTGAIACNVPTAGAGSCISTASCTGYYYSGYCAGASNIRCCIPTASASAAQLRGAERS